MQSYAKVNLKRSSSSGKTGYDIEIVSSNDLPLERSKKILQERLEIALNLAIESERQLNERRL